MDFGNLGNLMWFVCRFCGKADLDQRKMEWHEWHDHLKDQDRNKPEPQSCFMGLPFENLKSQLPSHSGTSMLQQHQQLQQQIQQQQAQQQQQQQAQQQQQQQQQHQQKQQHKMSMSMTMAERSQMLKMLDSTSGSPSAGTDMRNSSLTSLYSTGSSNTDNKPLSLSHSATASSSAASSSSSSSQNNQLNNGQIPPSTLPKTERGSNDPPSPKPTKGTRTKSKGKPKAKNFECSHCSKMFSSSQNLTVHIRTHLGERPYVCRFPDKTGAKCEKAFTNQSNRDTHERLHTGIKPFKCSFCEKTFTNSSNRTMHERIHTGDRPYKCDECSSSYTSSSNLKNHKKTHFVFQLPS